MAYTARSALNTRNGRLAYLPATAATAANTDRQNASRIESAPKFSIVISASLLPVTQASGAATGSFIIFYPLFRGGSELRQPLPSVTAQPRLETLADLVAVGHGNAETNHSKRVRRCRHDCPRHGRDWH